MNRNTIWSKNSKISLSAKQKSSAKAALLLIVNDKGLILATARRHDLLNLGIPGGSRNIGETLVDCAIRELAEETQFQPQGKVIPIFIDEAKGVLTVTFTSEHYQGKIQTNLSLYSIESFPTWQKPAVFLQKTSEFRNYNQRLFSKLKII